MGSWNQNSNFHVIMVDGTYWGDSTYWSIFNAWCTTVHSAVLLSHVVCLSVCDVGGSWPHRWKILETNYVDNYPNVFALRCPKIIHLLSGEHGEILGRLGVGSEKVGCWSTKAAISLKRVKIEEKLLCRAYKKSTMLFRFFGSPPYFYFRFHLCSRRDGRFCLIFARTAQRSTLDGANGLSSSGIARVWG